MKAAGFWTWWNQFSPLPFAACVDRAKKCDGVIMKANYWTQFDAFKAAGAPVAVERYVYPAQPLQEARYLAEGIQRGARFAVVNAEVEWDNLGSASGAPMKQLLDELERLAPGVQVYASVDTRGGRTLSPHQRELIGRCAGVMPMIYPKAFRPAEPPGFVAAAFRDCLDSGQDFQGKPVLPTIQAYDQIGAEDVRAQFKESDRRGFLGCNLYTVGHASLDEWAAFARLVDEEKADMGLLEENAALKSRHDFAAMIAELAEANARGQRLPRATIDQIMYVLALAKAQG